MRLDLHFKRKHYLPKAIIKSLSVFWREFYTTDSRQTNTSKTNSEIMRSGNSKQTSLESNFSNSLEAVLSDWQAYDTFRKWIMNDKDRTIDALDLWLAVKAYDQYARNRNRTLQKISLSIHKKYISPRTGSAWFVPLEIRRQISQRLHSFSREEMPPADLFDSVKPYTWSYLCDLHTLFVCSEEFHEMMSDEIPESARTIITNQEMIENRYDAQPSTSSVSFIPKSTSLIKIKQRLESSNIDDFEFKTRKFRSRPRSEPPCAQEKRALPYIPPENSNSNFADDASICRRLKRQQLSRHIIPKEKIIPLNFHTNEIRHDRLEERAAFADDLIEKLLSIADAVKQQENETGQVVYARELFYDARKSSNWDEEEAPLPELFALPQPFQPDHYPKQQETSLFLPNAQNFATSDSDVTFFDTDIENKPSTAFFNSNMNFDPYGKYGFAPPPADRSKKFSSELRDFAAQYPTMSYQTNEQPVYGSYWTQGKSISHFSLYGNQFSDSSGFCSSESAHLPYFNQNISMRNNIENDRNFNHTPKDYSSSTLQRPSTLSNHSNKNIHPFATLPRPNKKCQEPFNKLIVIYKDCGIPYVVKVDPYEMTFRDFRRQYGISSKINKRFFFKSICEDSSAPYQWTLIMDDSMVLPIFEGKIIAESKDTSDFQ